MNRAIFILVIAFMVVSCKHETETTNQFKNDYSAIQDSLSSKLKAANKDGEVVGFSVNIVDQNGSIYNKGFGYQDSKNTINYHKNTAQNIGSVAKTLLGISLLKAQELGKLNIDDPINKYLPFDVVHPKYPEIPITIRHLATHSSSIIDNEENYLRAFILENEDVNNKEEVAFSHFQKPEKRISLLEFLESCLSVKGQWYTVEMFSDNAPGDTFEYSNFGADICGLVIAEATGMSYAEFTSKYIFDELDMNNSGWTIKSIDSLKRSKFYLFKDQKIADYTAITYPNGGLFTSSEDLGKFLTELIKGYEGDGTLLSKAGYKTFYQKQFNESLNEKGRINVGVFNEYNNDFIGSKELLIGHNGSDFGSFALMYFNPKTKIGTIIMSNTDIDYKDDIVVPVIKEIWKNVIEYKDSLKPNP
ncbi:MAG: class A beta-lactamase-related serine hydrolase [Winogradskyella sp.]|uniref:serine hydrolase domain-containing protein n=1 Tax=Winogradskyella sp. TaxID=1883156 RepID=UPI000F3F8CF6|nr:serine hydrolase domain-containing protein [Winogradskyella sp.]RNC87274.1 MAG: class A beta-lactamase-related serine hydrolase [Winogradskyella sp.]